MSPQITYEDLNSLSNLFGFPKEFYFQLIDVLIKDHNLGFLCPSPGISANSLFVLNHIARRTFPFNKLFEVISIPQILNGLPSLAIAGCPCSKQTIWRCLDKLSAHKLLIKLVPRSDIECPRIYALNLPLVLTVLNKNLVDSLRQSSIKSKIRSANQALLFLKNCIEHIEHFQDGFDFLVRYNRPTINDFNAFYSKLETHLPDGHEKSSFDYTFMRQRERDMKKINRLEEQRKLKG